MTAKKTLKSGKEYLYIFFALIIGFAGFLPGCTTNVDEDPEVQRMKDSVNVYSALNTAYSKYKDALKAFQDDQKSSSKKLYDQCVDIFADFDMKVFNNPRNSQWKSDFNELGRSIVQDYLASQLEIEDNSKVFKLADKFKIKYEKVNVYTKIDVEPLPDGKDVPLIRNNFVDEYIDFFSKTDRGRGFVDKTLYRSGMYFPLMRKIIRFHNAPEEIVYLSVVESGLSPTIVSKAGATGLWQFMPSTGSSYGLYSDSYRDDRRDFEKSTDAASRHLKDLYRSFDDWYLAFASYNAGPGRITSAMSKSGSKDFWSIRSYLPGETKNYVPSILAISYIFRDPESYGFKDVEFGKPITFDRINIKANLTFDQVADFSGSDIESIRSLNPELLQDALPPYDVPYQLRIPRGSYDKFISNYKKSIEFEKNGMIEPEYAGDEEAMYADEPMGSYYKVEGYNPGDDKYVVNTQNKKKISYTFKSTDNLKIVSDSFRVRPSDIRIWNNLPVGIYPKPNQILNIYLSESSYNKLYGIEESKPDSTEKEIINEKIKEKKEDKTEVKNSDKEKNKPVIITTEVKKKEKTDKKQNTNGKKEQSYTVKGGDGLGIIAELYGVKIQDIKDWNDLKDDKILVGQVLKIYSDKKVETTVKKIKETSHKVQEGENLSTIANNYDVTAEDLMNWNNLDDDKILVGQVLAVVEPVKIDVKEKTSKNNSKAKTHKVQEGENLSNIAGKFDVTVDDIMEWNNLDNDKILVGQTLIVSDPGNNTTKEKTKEKTKERVKKIVHTVKKGENLQKIADEYGIEVTDIKEWNSLKSDKITVGQELKIIVKDTGTKKK